MTDHTVCRACGSRETRIEPENCDFDDRPQILATVCFACGHRMRTAADHPDSEGCFWQSVIATCAQCGHEEGWSRRCGETPRFDCEKCGAACRVRSG